MGSKLKRALLLLLTVAICLGAASAQAATASKDGIEVTLSTDKAAYKAGEKIQVTLEISNNGDSDVSPVTVHYSVPNTCMVDGKSGGVEEIEMLKSGETKTIQTTVTVVKQPTSDEVPSTGDHSNIFLWAALAAVSLFGLSRMGLQNLKRLFALVLCVVLMSSMLPAGVSTARAEEEKTVKLEFGKDPSRAVPPIMDDVASDADETEDYASSSDPVIEELAEQEAADEEDEFEEEELLSSIPIGTFEEDVARTLEMGISVEELANAVPKKAGAGETEASVSGMITVSEPIKVINRETEVSVSVSYGDSGAQEQKAWVYSDAIGEPLWYTQTSRTKTKYNKTIKSGVSMPKSKHPYGKNADELYKLNGGSGTIGMTAIFNNKSYFETLSDGTGVDALLLYYASGNYANGYTGSQLANAGITVTGTDGMILRLMTDYSVNKYGFQVTKVIPHKQPTISSCAIASSNGYVKLKWKKLYNYSGYSIERAVVYSDGSVGTFYEIASKAKSSSTSFTDRSVTRGQTYAYRMRQVYQNVDGYYYGPAYSSTKYITIPAYLSAPDDVYAFGLSSKKVELDWDSVPGATGYAIYSSKKSGSGYKLAKRVSGNYTTVTAPKTNGLSYYKVRPYIKAGKYYFYGAYSSVEPNYALAVPKKVKGQQYTNDMIRLSWGKVSKAHGYDIYISQYPNSGFEYWTYTTGTSMTVTGLSEISGNVYFRIAAYRTDGSTYSTSGLSSAVVGYGSGSGGGGGTTPDPVEVRSLSVYEITAPNCNDIPTFARDNAMLTRMFDKASPSGNDVDMRYVKNASKTTIKNQISQMASLADSNDVTFFNMFCHGASSITTGTQAGKMALSDGSYMTFSELATALNAIPGRVVIVLLSCGSGSSIDRTAGGEELTGDFDGDAYAKEFIKVISEQDQEITFVEPVDANGEMPATGELKKSGKFYVIACARGGESGIYSVFTALGEGFSHLIKWMFNGVVKSNSSSDLYYLSNITGASITGSMPADSNSNNVVTLGEMETWLNSMSANNKFTIDGATYQMRPQVYPSGSSFELFIKR